MNDVGRKRHRGDHCVRGKILAFIFEAALGVTFADGSLLTRLESGLGKIFCERGEGGGVIERVFW